MKRMGGSRPFDVERNMSYTNLAAMASSFETSARLVPAGGATRTGGSQAQLETIYAKAQELINTGCELSAERQHSARHRDVPVPVRLCAGCRRTRRTRSRQSSPTRKVPTCCILDLYQRPVAEVGPTRNGGTTRPVAGGEQ